MLFGNEIDPSLPADLHPVIRELQAENHRLRDEAQKWRGNADSLAADLKRMTAAEPRQNASIGHGGPSDEKPSNVVAIRSTQYGNGTLNPAMDTWKREWPEY
jgi:hypothetical protein